jgi:hypothetical protein
MEKKNHWVMDYETICNCFVGVFVHYKDDSVKRTFVINKSTIDFTRFISFLKGNTDSIEYMHCVWIKGVNQNHTKLLII